MSDNRNPALRAVVDADGHIMEDANLWLERIAPKYRDRLSDSDQESIPCETAASLYRLDLDWLTPVAAEVD